jgi:hypothetical protein
VSGDHEEFCLVADAAGTMERLFRGLEAVDASGLRDWTLIGGLAVMVRLSSAHRATGDIDTLVLDAEPEGRMVLLTQADQLTNTGVTLADGTKIDVIDVASQLDVNALPDESRERMFVLSHWWMAGTADDVRVQLVRGPGEGSATVVDRRLRLARPAGLVAAKLQSIRTRRDARPEKRFSDSYDFYRLLGEGRSEIIARELATAPADLGTGCAQCLEDLFVGQATRTARWISSAAGSVVEALDVEAVGSLAVETLLRHLSQTVRRNRRAP